MISWQFQAQRWERKPIIWAIISRKLPEIEKQSPALPHGSAFRVTHCCFHLLEHLSG